MTKVKKENKKEEIIKSFGKIKVNQNENNLRDITKNLNNLNYIGVTTIFKKKKEKKEKIKNENKIKSFTEKKIKITKSYNNIFDIQNRKLILMKELVYLPFGKRRTIIDIIKTNNLSNKSVSPTAKTIFKIFNDSKDKKNKNISVNTSINLKYKEKK